jgi:hypothetical protein
MTAQANNGQKKSWIMKGEQPLKKKGVGCGIHQSNIICSTVGWLAEASQTLKYGKTYEGYWNGEMFVKQVQSPYFIYMPNSNAPSKLKEKIVLAFECVHRPGYQALIMVDNSQGHSAYGEDALLVSCMNLRPGGKQACLKDGWYLRDDNAKIIKVFTLGHLFRMDSADCVDCPSTGQGLYTA